MTTCQKVLILFEEGDSMLVRYKKHHKKIAMGLLSFMPDLKELSALQTTFQTYEDEPDWKLYLWKDDSGDDFVGIVGVAITDDRRVTLQHISVNPSHRGQGIGHLIVNALQKELGEDYEIVPNAYTENFLSHCTQS